MASASYATQGSYIDYYGIGIGNDNVEKTKAVVLDLENTLVYSTSTFLPHHDYTVSVRGHQEHSSPSTITYYVQKRPAVDLLLLELARSNYEVVVFTSADQEYADAILDKLDVEKVLVDIRMYRDSCTMLNEGGYAKDLKKLGRQMKDIIMVDDNPLSYKLQPQNAFPVKPFSGDLNDRELWNVRELCKIAAKSSDMRETIRIYLALCDSNNLEYERLRERRRELELIRAAPPLRKKIIALELMDVLINTSMDDMKEARDFIVPVRVSGNLRTVYVQKRPGLDNLLSELEQNYEIVLFTRATQEQADPILDKLDINFHLNRRLYRNSCRGARCWKDFDALRKNFNLDVNLKNVIIVDCDRDAFRFSPNNGVLISPFKDGDLNDTELCKLKGFCKGAALYDDVREAITRWTNNEINVYKNIKNHRRSSFIY